LGLDAILMALVVVVTLVGLQSVGLVLVIALLVTPAAAARFWTEHLKSMAIGSAALGAASSYLGSIASALFPKLPSGAMIVLAGSGLFLISLLLGIRRGMVVLWLRRQRLNRRIDRQHVLRGMFELAELDSKAAGRPGVAVSNEELWRTRSWSRRRFDAAVDREIRDGLIQRLAEGPLQLTEAGRIEAARLVREHRLWEIYLIKHADLAVSQVDRDADAIEHVLEPNLIEELESTLAGLDGLDKEVPPDPHAVLAGPVDRQGDI
jgi:manganese/zinc/iron transport system permease protein